MCVCKFRGESYSFLKMLGPRVALIAPDSRSERSKKQIISPESWSLIFDRLNNLPGSVQHVVMLTTVPVLYPKVRKKRFVVPTLFWKLCIA